MKQQLEIEIVVDSSKFEKATEEFANGLIELANSLSGVDSDAKEDYIEQTILGLRNMYYHDVVGAISFGFEKMGNDIVRGYVDGIVDTDISILHLYNSRKYHLLLGLIMIIIFLLIAIFG